MARTYKDTRFFKDYNKEVAKRQKQEKIKSRKVKKQYRSDDDNED